MRILVCLAPLLAVAAAPGAAPQRSADRCGPAQPTPADAADTPLIHSLGAEPGAHQEIAVERLVGPCVVPIVVRENVGGTSPPVTRTPRHPHQTSSTSRR